MRRFWNYTTNKNSTYNNMTKNDIFYQNTLILDLKQPWKKPSPLNCAACAKNVAIK